MNDQAIAVTATFIRKALEENLPDDLEGRARRAFELALDNSYSWMLRSADDKFRAGLTALLLVTSDEETKERIVEEMRTLAAMAAAANNPCLTLNIADDHEPIGLLRIFKEVRGK